MGPRTAVLILVLCSARAIRVPIDWSESAVNPQKLTKPYQDVETFSETEIVSDAPNTQIPVEYFQYPANKPQFAVDVAAFHGVKNPEQHYSASPVRPYTGKQKPVLGQHHIFNEQNPVYSDFQQFTKINEDPNSHVKPESAEYKDFHPYKAEEPGLQDLYKDPVLEKIRNDIYNSQTRLQNYEKEAGKPDIKKDEYLESPEETDRKKFPHRNVPLPYEIHRPQRRPVYYRPSPYNSRDHYLNNRFRHPWNQHNAKIRPLHYLPLKHHLKRLRQNHVTKYDDENNQYPQVPTKDQLSEVSDGYDIYEKGKARYVALRNNVDESINKVKQQNRPETYQKLELQNNDDTKFPEDESDFVPIKNYAQVRKTETTRHLPKSAAFEDAVSFDEIKNAPRLREAVKSTKAQTVYTEEGYEDAAYDHEGEEKHAAENEAHGGHLTEKEISGGKYKTPSESQKYQDTSGNEYRDQALHGEQWKDSDKEKEKEAEEEDYSEDEMEQSIEADIYDEVNSERDNRENEPQPKTFTDATDESKTSESAIERNKREYHPDKHPTDKNKFEVTPDIDTILEHEEVKRETNFKIPEINLNSTFLSKDELVNKNKLVELAKLKTQHKKTSIKEKYPYYFQNLKSISKHSPLRYAENLKFIPQKTSGGTEFYDSRSKILECPEVDDTVDALPEKLKKGGHPDESEDSESDSEESQSKDKGDFSQLKKSRRLKGLGDKIDCFKAKFFGENPLDSPFFKEDIIMNPEPVTAPNIPTYKLLSKDPLSQASSLNNVFNTSDKFKENSKFNVTNLFDKLKSEQQTLQETLAKTNEELRSKLLPQNITIISNPQNKQQANVYTDVLATINSNLQKSNLNFPELVSKQLITNDSKLDNITYTSFLNKDSVYKSLKKKRKRRSAPFVYEPYKIIKDGQPVESKKTTTTSNISPLIKQLQSSRLIDRVSKYLDDYDQPVKRNVPTRVYKDIGRIDREKNQAPIKSDAEFVEVSVDGRRGEPRYEVRLSNHKTKYVPVENKKSMMPEDYETRIHKKNKNKALNNTVNENKHVNFQTLQRTRRIRPTTKSFFDVSKFIPKPVDFQRASASNKISKVVEKPTTESSRHNKNSNQSLTENEEEYDEYDYEEDEIPTTTTTVKPIFRRRKPKSTTTTAKPEEEIQELPKLRLITRFNTTPVPITITTQTSSPSERPSSKAPDDYREQESPKYREKKKKSSKSTLVTDTKTYGDDNDNMMKDEVDAMIGVKHNMEEYKPLYEKEIEEKNKKIKAYADSSEENDDEDVNEDERSFEDSRELSDEDDEFSEEEESDSSESTEAEQEVTTPEPSKQTLVATTETPISTTEARSAKLELKPIIHRKKIEIHKELPVNKSSPHITQFKQDIKEVEIIKEMPARPKTTSRRKPQKNVEALQLYKDDKLAEEINKLGVVEVFKENLDLVKGPKHGGNYRSADTQELVSGAKDPEASQTKNEKLVELTESVPNRRIKAKNGNGRSRNNGRNAKLDLSDSQADTKKLHGGNLKSYNNNDEKHTDRNKNGKLLELDELSDLEADTKILNGGNLKSYKNINNDRTNRNKNAKLIELDEERDDNDSSEEMHGGNFKSFDYSRSRSKSLHGGNYRSAKIIQPEETVDKTNNEDVKISSRNKAAGLLNTFAQAIPHLTTTPAYIRDPSKRMYYYVDA